MLKRLTGWRRADVLTKEGRLHPEAGTPRGGVIPPLPAKVYLDRLDQAGRKAGQHLGEISLSSAGRNGKPKTPCSSFGRCWARSG